MYPQQPGLSNRRLVIIVLSSLALITVLVALWSHNRSQLTATITTDVTPIGSAVTLNGKSVGAGDNAVRPGQYTVVFSHSGFDTQTKKVTVVTGDKKYVAAILAPNTAATQGWYQLHPADEKKAESISSRSYDEQAKTITQKLPLINDLPFVDQFYRIDYGVSKQHPDDPNAVALYITFWSADGKQQALDWLKFKGYDPAKLEIIYDDQSNNPNPY